MRRIAFDRLTRLLCSECSTRATCWQSRAMRTSCAVLKLYSPQPPQRWSHPPQASHSDDRPPRHEPESHTQSHHRGEQGLHREEAAHEGHYRRGDARGGYDDAHTRSPATSAASHYHTHPQPSQSGSRPHSRDYDAHRSHPPHTHPYSPTSGDNHYHPARQHAHGNSSAPARGWGSPSSASDRPPRGGQGGRPGSASFSATSSPSSSYSKSRPSSGRRRPESFFIRNAQSLLELKRRYKRTFKKSEQAQIRRDADRLLHLTRIDMSTTDEAAVTTLLNCAALLSPTRNYLCVDQAVQWMRQNLHSVSLQNVALFTNALGLLRPIAGRAEVVQGEIDPLVSAHVKDFTPVEIVMMLQAHQRLGRAGRHDALEDTLVKQLLPCIPVMPISQLSTLTLVLVRHGLRVREPAVWRELVDAVVRTALTPEAVATMHSRDVVSMFTAAAVFEMPAAIQVALMKRLTDTARFHRGEDVVSIVRSLSYVMRPAGAVARVDDDAVAQAEDHEEEEEDHAETEEEDEGCTFSSPLASPQQQQHQQQHQEQQSSMHASTPGEGTGHTDSSNTTSAHSELTASAATTVSPEVREAALTLRAALQEHLERMAPYVSFHITRRLWTAARRSEDGGALLTESIQRQLLRGAVWALGHQRIRISALRHLIAHALDGASRLPSMDIAVAASHYCVGRWRPSELEGDGASAGRAEQQQEEVVEEMAGGEDDSHGQADPRGAAGEDSEPPQASTAELTPAPRFYVHSFSDLVALRIGLENLFAAHDVAPPDSLTQELPHQLVQHVHLARTYHLIRALMFMAFASVDCPLRNHDNDAALQAEMLAALHKRRDSIASEISARRLESVLRVLHNRPKLAAFTDLLQSVHRAEDARVS